LFDADDRLVIANRANSAMASARPGVSFSTLLEHAAAGLMHPDTLGDDPQAWISWRLARHRNPIGPIEQRYRDGRWVRIDETRTREGGTVVVRTDITELKKIEETLRFSEERFRDYTETASDWNWETDAEHRFTYLSTQPVELDQSSDHLVTTPLAKLIGMRRADLALDADDPKWRAHQAALDRREPYTGFVYKTLSIAGKERHVSTSGKPVFDAKGNFVGYRGTGRDVTEQVEAEASLREAKAAAEAASRAKSEFLAAMSHELRTPLNAIIGFSEIIAHQRFVADPARIRSYAADIHSSGQHLLKVINDILEVSRIEAGKLELHEQAVDLVAAVETCVMLVGQRATEGDVALHVTMPRDLPYLLADETRIKQIFLNLLSNAVKFTPRGRSVSVTAGLSYDGSLAVSVCDDGIGMTADEIVVAMQPFRQVDSSLSRRFEGSGLGLPLTKAFTELHGGRLDITSAPGQGTTVHVTFPPSRVVAAALSVSRANAS
jgi:signal transduction histidine kinase